MRLDTFRSICGSRQKRDVHNEPFGGVGVLIALLLMLTNVARAASFDDAIAATNAKTIQLHCLFFDRWQKRVTRGRKQSRCHVLPRRRCAADYAKP